MSFKKSIHVGILLGALALATGGSVLAGHDRPADHPPIPRGPGVSVLAPDEALPFSGDLAPGRESPASARENALLESLSRDLKAAPYDDLGGDDVLVATDLDIRDVDLDIAENGDIYAVVQVNVELTGYEIRIYRSQDGGDSWPLWGSLSHSSAAETFSRPSLVVAEGAEDRLYLAYRRQSLLNDDEIHLVHAELSGTVAAFSPPVVVMAVPGSDFDYPDLATDNESYSSYYLYLVAEDNDATGGDIWYSRSTDRGATFEAPYEIATLSSSDREYNQPQVCWGYGSYVHVSWTFSPRAGATFDEACRYRRCSANGSGGLAAWDPAIMVTSSTNGVDEFRTRIAASVTSSEVLIGTNRNEAGVPMAMTIEHYYSLDSGGTFPGVHTAPAGIYSLYNVLYQAVSGNFICQAATHSPGIIRAHRSDLASWTAVEYFGDVAYLNGAYARRAFALDPSHEDRLAVAWPYIGYDYDEPVEVYFDAEWRADPGYPNLEDGFPVALDHAPRSAPAVVDLDRDGDLEIVFTDAGNRIVAHHHDGSTVDGWPVTVPATLSLGPVAVGALGLDGRLSLLVGSADGKVFGYKEDGSPLAGFPHTMPTADPAFVVIGALGGPYPRTAAVLCGPKITCLNHRGELVPGALDWTAPSGDFFSHPPAIGDIDGDGISEIVAAGQDFVLAVQLHDPAWILWKSIPAAASGAPSLADFDLDGDVEIVIPTMDGTLVVKDGDGSDWPGWPQTMPSGSPLTSAALGNLLGTGEPEIAFAERNWTVNLYYQTGAVCTSYPRETTYGWYLLGAPIIGLVDGSWSSDVIIGSRDRSIWAWSNFAALIPGWPKPATDPIQVSPVLGDVDLDGRAEIAYLSLAELYLVDINNTLNTGTGAWPMFGYDPQRTGCLSCPEDVVTGVGDPTGTLTRVSFAQPSPNPSPGRTTFTYTLPERAQARLEIYDVRGRRLRTVLKAEQDLGPQVVSWDGRDRDGRPVADGTYFARLLVRGPAVSQELARKVLILR
ncbi:MAG: FlgD immunoglobulin-like domain containing protein [bacterium]